MGLDEDDMTFLYICSLPVSVCGCLGGLTGFVLGGIDAWRTRKVRHLFIGTAQGALLSAGVACAGSLGLFIYTRVEKSQYLASRARDTEESSES